MHIVERLIAANRETPFIFFEKNDNIESVGRQIRMIQMKWGDRSIHVALSVGIYNIVVVQG